MKSKCTKENSCAGKIRFNTIEESNKHVKNLNSHRKHKRMKTYACQYCGGFHYGHETHRRMSNQTKPTYIPDYDPDEVDVYLRNISDPNKFINIKNNNL